jgi:hypothetical protein
MKKITLMLLSLIFILSCAKEQSLVKANENNQNETNMSYSFVGVGTGNGIENPFLLSNSSVLPPSVISFINPTYTPQFSIDTIHTLTPNSPVFSNSLLNSFDAPYVPINCPKPKPELIPNLTNDYIHPFGCPSCEGGSGKPGCPIMEEIFGTVNFKFVKRSVSTLIFEIYYKNNTLIYTKELKLTSAKTYVKEGNISSIITNAEIENYLKNKDIANTSVIVRKFFNFFHTKLITSN